MKKAGGCGTANGRRTSTAGLISLAVYRGDQLPRFCSDADEWAIARSFGCRQMARVSSDRVKRISNFEPSGFTGTAKSTR